MRISGGTARGIPLSVPAGDAVRPATDGLRQALFSSLAPRLAGARFVDLFAGSGAYGLEALSRGAESGVFVERHARTAGLIRQNLAAVARSLRREPRDLGEVIAADAVTWTPRPGTPPADLVFIDPPYEVIAELAPRLFASVAGWLPPGGDPLLVFETPGELALTDHRWVAVKRIGGTGARQPGVTLFRRAPSSGEA